MKSQQTCEKENLSSAEIAQSRDENQNAFDTPSLYSAFRGQTHSIYAFTSTFRMGGEREEV